MLKDRARATAVTACVFAAFVASATARAESTDNAEGATSFVAALTSNDFAKAEGMFADVMSAALPLPKLKSTWEAVIQQSGTFQRRVGTRTEKAGAYDVVFVTCAFQRARLDIKVVFDGSGKIAGLFFQPAAPSSEAKAPYVDQTTFDEKEVAFGSDTWRLPGTLSMPKGPGPFPAVALVHGSGPQDRDETVGANKPFRDLAWGLASKGIAVLRYEKRTKARAADLNPLPLPFTVKEETIDDAAAALMTLEETPGIDASRVFVLGHSLGATLVPRILAQMQTTAGGILLAASARPLEDVILEQTNYLAMLDGDKTTDEQKRLDAVQVEVNRIKHLTDADAKNASLIFGAPASYWLDLRADDPLALAAKISRPLFVLQGKRDYQVTMKDFALWQSALANRKNAQLKSYPELNHLFMAGSGAAGPAEYERPSYVSPEVIDDIVTWLKGNKK